MKDIDFAIDMVAKVMKSIDEYTDKELCDVSLKLRDPKTGEYDELPIFETLCNVHESIQSMLNKAESIMQDMLIKDAEQYKKNKNTDTEKKDYSNKYVAANDLNSLLRHFVD